MFAGVEEEGTNIIIHSLGRYQKGPGEHSLSPSNIYAFTRTEKCYLLA